MADLATQGALRDENAQRSDAMLGGARDRADRNGRGVDWRGRGSAGPSEAGRTGRSRGVTATMVAQRWLDVAAIAQWVAAAWSGRW